MEKKINYSNFQGVLTNINYYAIQCVFDFYIDNNTVYILCKYLFSFKVDIKR